MRVGCRTMDVEEVWGTKAAPAVEAHESAAMVMVPNFIVLLGYLFKRVESENRINQKKLKIDSFYVDDMKHHVFVVQDPKN